MNERLQETKQEIAWLFYSNPKPDKKDVLKELKVAEKLVQEGYLRQAFITAWSAFEAATHTQNIHDNISWQSPKSILEFLEYQGIIVYETGIKLKSLLKIRNSIVHGDLTKDIKSNDINFLITTSQKIIY